MRRNKTKENTTQKKMILDMGLHDIEKRSRHLREHTRRNIDTAHVNYKIQHLLYDPFTFINAYAKISKNKGALTEGINEEKIIQLFGLEKASMLAEKIKQNRYEFQPVKRTWIPKPGKKKKRPIDVPNQTDRIVQEAVRGILEAIYEPVFREFETKTEFRSSNYGFRPKKSCWSAIEKLTLHSKRCNIILEGDIVSAYNNVDHHILLQILKKRIKDKKFLKFVEKMLKSGIMDSGRFEHSLNGTPQGGIVSPLLFNIYMHEFDKYVYEQCIIPIQNSNTDKKQQVRSLKYNQINYATKKARLEYVKNRELDRIQGGCTNKDLAKRTKKIYKLKLRIQQKTPYYNEVGELERGAIFVRYADDWVLALTCSHEEALEYKEKIRKYLKDHLKMELDDKKTSVTLASKGYKFLGFEILRPSTKPKIMRVLQKDKTGKYVRLAKRTTSRLITVEPDTDRILKRLRLLKMCDQMGFPKGKPSWTIYDEFQIVQKYAQIMRGIFNYYKPCERINRLNRISYILQYSCAKTIAIRKKISMAQVFKIYGIDLTIKKTLLNTKTEKLISQRFYDLTQLKKMEKKKLPTQQKIETPDPFHIKEFWRTKFKIFNECCICGSMDNIQLHHINSIASMKEKKDNAAAIRSQINRLQIPVCHSCHKDITHGKYSDPRKPIQFYNEFIAKL